MDLSPGQRIDRYEIVGLIGQGGLASVYRVRHVDLEADRAMKVLHLSSGPRLERLRREGRLQAQLSHPGIVQVTDVVPLPGGLALVMELVEGCTLREWAEREDPSLADRLRVFREIVDAVGFAHEHDIIHRDLKPENVLMASLRGTWVPKVADFGLARALDDDRPRATQSGVGMGTPRYMAPEQIRDASRVDHRADIFALGCVLYLLACGREAFAGPHNVHVWGEILAGRHTDPQDLRPDLPAPVADAIRACLRPVADDRPQDCMALLAILDGAPAPPAARAPQATFDGLFSDEASPGEDRLVRPEASATTLAPPSHTTGPVVAPPAGRQRLVVAVVATVVLAAAGLALWRSPLARDPASPAAPAGPVVEVEARELVEPSPPDAPEQAPPVAAPPAPSRRAEPDAAPPAPVQVVIVEAEAPSAVAPSAVAPSAVAPSAEVPSAEVPSAEPALPEAEPDPVPVATVQVAGPGEVTLRSAETGRRFPPGEVPPGRYEIEVRFGERTGSGFAFTVAAGETATLSCSEATEVCRRR